MADAPSSDRVQRLMVQTLAFLKAMHWSHWTSHWQVQGQPFYGDHELFNRLYAGIADQIDGLAEKIVAFYGPDAVDPLKVEAYSTMILRKCYMAEDSIPRRALTMEKHFQDILKKLYDAIKESGEMSLGLDDFIMALANDHETNIYLLTQRMSATPREAGDNSLRSKVIKLAHEHPEFRGDLLPILKEAAGQYVMVKELPKGIQFALKEIGYGRKDIRIEPRSTYSPSYPADDGARGFTAVVDLTTDRYKVEWGSWGGANMFTQKQVDLDTKNYPIPVNGVVIQGQSGRGQPTYAVIQANPDNLQKLLPSGAEVELDDKEKKAIKIIKSYKPGYRPDAFDREGLGKYSPENPIIKKFIDNGLVKVTGAGLQITLAGKNMAESITGIHV